jgi:hypothetical protein
VSFIFISCQSEQKLTETQQTQREVQAQMELYAKKSQMIFDSKKGLFDTIQTYPEASFDSLEGADVFSARVYLFSTTAIDEEVKFVDRMERLKVKDSEIQSFIDSLNQKDTLLKAMELEFIKMNKLDTTLYPYEN